MSMANARLKQEDLNVFDWDQGNFDTRTMAFMWYKEEVTPMIRKLVQLDFQQYSTTQPLKFKGAKVRATLELDRVKRLSNNAQAIFIGQMREYAKLPRETCDIRWVDSGLRVSVATPRRSSEIRTPVTSFTIGTTSQF